MSEEWRGAHPGSVELRLVLVGTYDCGKTLTADTLLGQKSPQQDAPRSCVLRQGLSHGRRLSLVDTPRWYWSGGHLLSSIQEETKQALSLAAPGPHAFLLLIPVNQFTDMERHAPQELEEVFGRGVLRHTLVVITCGDYLMGRTVEQYLDSEDQGLREVITLCGGRYHVLNNRQPEDREQVQQLLEKVERMVAQRGGCYVQGAPRPESPDLTDQVLMETQRGVSAERPEAAAADHTEPAQTTETDGAEARRRENEGEERERLEKEREEKERLDKERREAERETLEEQKRAELEEGKEGELKSVTEEAKTVKKWYEEGVGNKKGEESEKEKEEERLQRRESRRKERLEREQRQKEEMERMEKERAERERIIKEREEMRIKEREKLEKEREEERLKRQAEIEKRESDRIEREQQEKAEMERIQKERAERERLIKEREEGERAEREKLEKEREEERLKRRESRRKERMEREQREKEEMERIERERAEREKILKEREERRIKERERLEKEREEERLKRQAEIEKRESERIEREQNENAEMERIQKERAERERLLKEREEEGKEQESSETGAKEHVQRSVRRRETIEERRDRLIRARAEREKLEQEIAERALTEDKKKEKERIEQERERIEQERQEREKEKEKEKQERIEQERERIEQERLEREEEKKRVVKESLERDKAERVERMEKQRKEGEMYEKERVRIWQQEGLRREKEKERIEKERIEQERERFEQERLMREKEKERSEKERLEREKAERTRAEKEQRERERIEREKQLKEERATSAHRANGLHSQMSPQKQQVLEQQRTSEDKQQKTKGSSLPTAEGAIRSQLSETGDKKTLKSIYHQITTGEDLSPKAPELRLVLLGGTVSGKSAAGNAILGRREFESRADTSVTQRCEKGRVILGNKRVAVVDTPDWFRSERSPAEVRSQLSSCVALSTPGPHAFLFCVPLHRPADPGQLQALGALEGVFGPGAVRSHTLVLFTHADRLMEGAAGTDGVEEHIASKRPDLLKLVEKCGDRYHIMERARSDGRGGGGEEVQRRSVEELLEKVEQTVRESGGGHYSCPLYQEADSRVRDRQEELLQARRERSRDHLGTLREEEEEEDEAAEAERTRDEAEKSVQLDSVPALSLPPAESSSFLRSVGEKVAAGMLAGAKKVPKVLAGGALVGGGLGVFLGGLMGGVAGMTGGVVLAEVARRKLSGERTEGDGQKVDEKKES